jgi:hypothetical protein
VTGDRLPDPDRLRSEVDAMVAAVVEALLDRFGPGILGLWFKGSAQKPWDTPIDYVPELSDVDIHFRADEATLAELGDLDTALALHADIGARFAAVCPSPAHIPRPQLVSAAEMERMPRFVPAPIGTVETLHGPVPAGPTDLDEGAVRRADAASVLSSADPQVLAKAIADLVERPGHHLFALVKSLSWRVAPLGPRILSVLGVDYDSAWSGNRTSVVHRLCDFGQPEIAGHVVAFYEGAWDAYLSGWADGDAGRAAFASAVRALRLGAAVAAAEVDEIG